MDITPSFLANLQAAYILHDASSRIIDWNKKACELLGLSQEQMQGKSAMDPDWHFVNEAGQQITPAEYPVNRVIASKEYLSDLIYGIVASAHANTVWVQVSAVPVLNAERDVVNVLVTFMDVSRQIEEHQRLQISEQEHRAVISVMHEGLIVQSKNGEIIACNPAAEQMLGLSVAQMRDRKSIDPDWKCIYEDGSDFPDNQHPAIETLRTGKSLQNIVMGVQKVDGTLSWISINTAPILEKNSFAPIAVVSTFNDITRLKNSQDALRSNTQFLQTIIDGVTEGLCVFHQIEQPPYVEFTVWNSYMREITGYSIREINNEGWQNLLFPDAEKKEQALRRMSEIQNEEMLRHEDWEITRADGEKRILSVSTRILETPGEQPGVLALIQDITEKYKVEKVLRESESLFRGLVEASPVAMLVVSSDKSHKVIHINQRFTELFGYTIEDIPDVEHWWPIAYPDRKYREIVQREWQARLEESITNETGRIREMEAEVYCKNGEIRNIEFHMALLQDKALVIFNDLTMHRIAEESLRRSAAVIRSTSEGIMITDVDMQILSVNRAFTQITGYEEAEVLGEKPGILSSGRHGSEFYENLWDSIVKSGHWQGEIWNRRKNGEVYPEWLTISAIRDENNRVVNFVGVFSDISSVKQSEQKLFFLAHHDPLTELPNRFHIFGQIDQAIHQARRHKNEFAVLFIDLDRFKHINDSYGHTTGDKVLLTIASRIRHALREQDIVARIGGDEFVVLLNDFSDRNMLARVAKKIIKSVSDPILEENTAFYLSASIGIAVYPHDGFDASALISNADSAMYRAKQSGRNTFQYYCRDMTDAALARVTLESNLRQALKNHQLSVYLQPVYNIESGKIIGAEVLARWIDPEQGVILPESFIPLAEENGLISDISHVVLHAACQIAEQLNRQNRDDLYLSINLSGKQFQRPGIFDELSKVINQYDFPTSMLEFEITETVFATPSHEMIETLKRIRETGITVAIDDFGTGFSSLSYLKKFPLDKLKIDRSFVSDIPDDENDMAIAKAIIALARSLQLDIVAEGVETEFQRDFLVAQGCHCMQGFLYSKPLQPDKFEEAVGVF